MSVATGIVCNDPPYDTYAALYSNMAFLTEQKANAVSFNGYTYSSSYSAYSYYQVNYSWKESAKQEWFGKAREWRAKAKEMERLAEEKKEAERLKRIDAYWEIHADEKAAFDAEKKELSDKITALNDEIARIPEKAELEKLTDDINSLDAEKKALGLFKLKEKKQLQEKIDEIKSQKTAVFEKVYAQERVIQKQFD
jgi:DNA repair exonuclease SbcCD ATPase subunit